MRYLKFFTAGEVGVTTEGFGFGGSFFEQASAVLQRRFGSPHLVVGAQIDKMSKHTLSWPLRVGASLAARAYINIPEDSGTK